MIVQAEREDQQSTTHAIQGSVVDTDSTFLNFDGITYGKGASVLKQLMAVVGTLPIIPYVTYYFIYCYLYFHFYFFIFFVLL